MSTPDTTGDTTTSEVQGPDATGPAAYGLCTAWTNGAPKNTDTPAFSALVAAAEAAAPAAGAVAVERRIERQALGEASVARQEETLRYVAGRTFRMQGVAQDAEGNPVALWVDVNFTDDMDVTEVVFGSDAYFDLLATSPEMAAWLSLSPALVVVTGEQEAVRVVLEE